MAIQYKLEGTPNSPVLVLSHSLGANLHMWDDLVPLLLPYFRVLRYDTQGHGPNPSTLQQFNLSTTPTIADLGRDVLQLLDENGIQRAHFCGLSMGGLIGQWLGVHHPERLHKLVLANTAAKIGNDETWNTRIETITQQGLASIVDATMERWFTENFRARRPEKVAQTRTMFLQTDARGYTRCCAAIRDADFQGMLGQIAVETLAITGSEDPVTNVEQAEFLRDNIPSAQLCVLEARHLSGTEAPEAFAEAILNFIVGPTRSERGMHVRRSVLGDAHVDKANASITDFNADFQQFITEYAWGSIWARPGLEKRERSLITLAMLIALNRKAEFQMHVRAALNNGARPDEIKELILQSALYCGLPAANEAFHNAAEILNHA